VEKAKQEKYDAEEALRVRRVKTQVAEERAALDETEISRRAQMLRGKVDNTKVNPPYTSHCPTPYTLHRTTPYTLHRRTLTP